MKRKSIPRPFVYKKVKTEFFDYSSDFGKNGVALQNSIKKATEGPTRQRYSTL